MSELGERIANLLPYVLVAFAAIAAATYLGWLGALQGAWNTWYSVNYQDFWKWAFFLLLGAGIIYLFMRKRTYERIIIPFGQAFEALGTSADAVENWVYRTFRENYELKWYTINRRADKAPTWFGFFHLAKPVLGLPRDVILTMSALWYPIPAGTRFMGWAPIEKALAWNKAYTLSDLSFSQQGWPENVTERILAKRLEEGDLEEVLPLVTGGSGAITPPALQAPKV